MRSLPWPKWSQAWPMFWPGGAVIVPVTAWPATKSPLLFHTGTGKETVWGYNGWPFISKGNDCKKYVTKIFSNLCYEIRVHSKKHFLHLISVCIIWLLWFMKGKIGLCFCHATFESSAFVIFGAFELPCNCGISFQGWPLKDPPVQPAFTTS